MAEETLSPISAAKPPAVNPLGAAASAHASTLKLKPVIRKPTIGGAKPGIKLPPAPGAAPAAAAAPAEKSAGSMDQLKTVTQKLKGVTQQIPQQAILHKTGIIADQKLTDAQKQAAKSRTARISLSDALGVAPVKEEAAPMKTIRIKRPVDIPGAAPAPAAAAAAPAPAAPAAEPVADMEASVTQRKTLKIARPSAGAVKPTGKFGIKKPSAAAPKPAEAAAPADGDVADIPDMPADAAAPAPAPVVAAPVPSADEVAGVPGGLLIFDFILQFAACLVVGFLGYLLYTDLNTAWF